MSGADDARATLINEVAGILRPVQSATELEAQAERIVTTVEMCGWTAPTSETSSTGGTRLDERERVQRIVARHLDRHKPTHCTGFGADDRLYDELYAIYQEIGVEL